MAAKYEFLEGKYFGGKTCVLVFGGKRQFWREKTHLCGNACSLEGKNTFWRERMYFEGKKHILAGTHVFGGILFCAKTCVLAGTYDEDESQCDAADVNSGSENESEHVLEHLRATL